jgi:hypothetical protein
MAVSPARDEYFPILYSTVASRKSATLGTDLNSERVRSEAIARARDGIIMATAQNVQLRNPIGGQRSAFFGVLPVYRKGVSLDTVAERRENTLGIIVGAFQTAAVFDAILDKAILPETVDLYLYPADAGVDAPPVFMRGSADRDQRIEAKPKQALKGLPYLSTPITAGDASWDLVVVPAQARLTSFHRAWLVLAAVLLVFGAVLAYMWASLRHAMRLETANSRILELAQTDLLTNLANRRGKPRAPEPFVEPLTRHRSRFSFFRPAVRPACASAPRARRRANAPPRPSARAHSWPHAWPGPLASAARAAAPFHAPRA